MFSIIDFAIANNAAIAATDPLEWLRQDRDSALNGSLSEESWLPGPRNIPVEALPAFEPIISDTGPVDPSVTPRDLPAFEPVVSDTGPLDPGDLLASANDGLAWLLNGTEPAVTSGIEPSNAPPSEHVEGGMGSLVVTYATSWDALAPAGISTIDDTI